jgi:hypothetical protein
MYQAIWSTEPTQRLDRPKKLKDLHLFKRSGYNKKIEDPEKMGHADQPISEKMLYQSTLRK